MWRFLRSVIVLPYDPAISFLEHSKNTKTFIQKGIYTVLFIVTQHNSKDMESRMMSG